jgi:nitroreductase
VDLVEAMETQRAIRRLKPDPVDDEVLLRCLRLATRAPTGGNRQPVEFVLIRDPATKGAIGRLYRFAWSLYGEAGRRLYATDEGTQRNIRAVDWQLEHWEQVPVLVLVCMRGVPIPVPSVLRTSRYGSVFPSVQNFLLAARNEGLGATLTTLPLWSRIAIHRLLSIPFKVEPVALIPVGWPLGRYGRSARRPVELSVHVDRYGNRPFAARVRKPSGATRG